jgi:hypothetical protein
LVFWEYVRKTASPPLKLANENHLAGNNTGPQNILHERVYGCPSYKKSSFDFDWKFSKKRLDPKNPKLGRFF